MPPLTAASDWVSPLLALATLLLRLGPCPAGLLGSAGRMKPEGCCRHAAALARLVEAWAGPGRACRQCGRANACEWHPAGTLLAPAGTLLHCVSAATVNAGASAAGAAAWGLWLAPSMVLLKPGCAS